MKVQKKQSSFVLHQGDCLNVLRTIPDNSIDSVVTDPPYGLSFMGKKWDYDVPSVDIWAECLRVLKPGGHLLAFAGTRTQHRMAVRIEDAGFEIRDMIAWVYGSGFPKSKNVALSIDKREGLPNRGHRVAHASRHHPDGTFEPNGESLPAYEGKTDRSAKWQGWGTALKPALEPITVARKPLAGTVAENVLAWGTGALNIDGCRVGDEPITQHGRSASENRAMSGANYAEPSGRMWTGRWPANLIHSGEDDAIAGLGEAARYFYCAKANKKDRGEGNTHPTVKPTDLMRYLCRLVTPPGGVVLDPFMGSGSTGKAAGLEGFSFVGIEREQSYLEIAEKRIKAVYDLESGSESTKDDNVAD